MTTTPPTPGHALPPLPAPVLADSTVWSKVRGRPELSEWFNAEVRAARVWVCEVIALELLRSARNPAAFTMQSRLLALLPSCPISVTEWRRAREVQHLLAGKSWHRGVPPADLLIAAAAEAANVPVLHYDHDYDLIAKVSGQPVRWFVPAGTLS